MMSKTEESSIMAEGLSTRITIFPSKIEAAEEVSDVQKT